MAEKYKKEYPKEVCPICMRRVSVIGTPPGKFSMHGPPGNSCVASGCTPDDLEAMKRRLAKRIEIDQRILSKL